MDAADGVMASTPLSEELSSKLHRLGYPEVAKATKPSLLLAKAIAACTKRLKKLDEFMPKNHKTPLPFCLDPPAASLKGAASRFCFGGFF